MTEKKQLIRMHKFLVSVEILVFMLVIEEGNFRVISSIKLDEQRSQRAGRSLST